MQWSIFELIILSQYFSGCQMKCKNNINVPCFLPISPTPLLMHYWNHQLHEYAHPFKKYRFLISVLGAYRRWNLFLKLRQKRRLLEKDIIWDPTFIKVYKCWEKPNTLKRGSFSYGIVANSRNMKKTSVVGHWRIVCAGYKHSILFAYWHITIKIFISLCKIEILIFHSFPQTEAVAWGCCK